jgi:hypothetical protein
MYISCMSKEDIEQAVADLVEAVRIDAAIEAAQSDYAFLSRLAYDAQEMLLELQRHKRDAPALRERLSSLLACGNISSEQGVERRVITANDRANYVVRIKNSSFAPAGYKLKPYMYDAIMSGELDHVIAEWLEETWG